MSYLLKMVQHTKRIGKNEVVNGIRDSPKEYVGVGDDYPMSFEAKDVLDLAVEGVKVLDHERQLNG